MRIVTVVGARPQFIKAAAVSRALRKVHEEVLVHTGQHYDLSLSKVFFEELGIPHPDHNLRIGSGPHGMQTGRMLEAIEKLLLEESPDAVLVYGDTNSTIAGALAAAKVHIPVGHVEAGLRSGDRTMPEELNRILTDHVSDGLFCPTQAAVENLAGEGITRGVHLVGDVMVDVFRRYEEDARQDRFLLEKHGLTEQDYWLMTMHRPANTDDPRRLQRILEGLGASGTDLLWPIHPRTRAALKRHGLEDKIPSNIHIIAPLPYRDNLAIMLHAEGILTDSGGIQKEALLAGRPCLTMRDTTEWPETIEAGWNRLVDADMEAVRQGIASFRPTGTPPELWGDGHAAERITRLLDRLT